MTYPRPETTVPAFLVETPRHPLIGPRWPEGTMVDRDCTFYWAGEVIGYIEPCEQQCGGYIAVFSVRDGHCLFHFDTYPLVDELACIANQLRNGRAAHEVETLL